MRDDDAVDLERRRGGGGRGGRRGVDAELLGDRTEQRARRAQLGAQRAKSWRCALTSTRIARSRASQSIDDDDDSDAVATAAAAAGVGAAAIGAAEAEAGSQPPACASRTAAACSAAARSSSSVCAAVDDDRRLLFAGDAASAPSANDVSATFRWSSPFLIEPRDPLLPWASWILFAWTTAFMKRGASVGRAVSTSRKSSREIE